MTIRSHARAHPSTVAGTAPLASEDQKRVGTRNKPVTTAHIEARSRLPPDRADPGMAAGMLPLASEDRKREKKRNNPVTIAHTEARSRLRRDRAHRGTVAGTAPAVSTDGKKEGLRNTGTKAREGTGAMVIGLTARAMAVAGHRMNRDTQRSHTTAMKATGGSGAKVAGALAEATAATRGPIIALACVGITAKAAIIGEITPSQVAKDVLVPLTDGITAAVDTTPRAAITANIIDIRANGRDRTVIRE